MKTTKTVYQEILVPITIRAHALKEDWTFIEGRSGPKWVESTHWKYLRSREDFDLHQYFSNKDIEAVRLLPPAEQSQEFLEFGAKVDAEYERFLEEGQWLWDDAWDVLSDFMAARTDDELLAFLNETGSFCDPPYPVPDRQDYYHEQDLQYPVTAFWELQNLLATMLRKRDVLPDLSSRRTIPQHWKDVFDYPVDLTFEKRFKERFVSQVGVRVATENTLSTLVSVARFGVIGGGRFRFCARPDCRRPFKVTSHHQQACCSHTCSHVHWQRKQRGTKVRVRDDRKQYGFGKY